MTQNKLTDGRSDRKYFTITPRLIGLLCRDVYEYTLWCIIKEIAGEKGECYLGTEDLAALAMQSMGKVSQARKRLIEAGLLKGEIRRDPGFQQSVWHLRIPDLWPQNIELAEKMAAIKDRVEFKRQQRGLHLVKPSPGERATTPGERATTPGERATTPGETKKNQEEEPKVEPTEKPRDFLPEEFPPEPKPPETPTDQHMTRLREKFGTDPLEAMVIAAEQTKTNDRPKGWTRVDADVWEICQIVAERFPCKMPAVKASYNNSTKEMVRQRIDKWTGGAALILELFDGNAQAALAAITAFRLEYDGGFTVAGPQSLLNVLPPFMARKGKPKKMRGGQRVGTWTEAELDEARQRAALFPPFTILYNLKDDVEFFALSKEERQARLTDGGHDRLVAWAQGLTGNGAIAREAAGGVEAVVRLVMEREK